MSLFKQTILCLSFEKCSTLSLCRSIVLSLFRYIALSLLTNQQLLESETRSVTTRVNDFQLCPCAACITLKYGLPRYLKSVTDIRTFFCSTRSPTCNYPN